MCHSAPKMLKRGLLLSAPHFFPRAPLWENSWHHCPCWLCSVCSTHREQGLCTLPHVPLLLLSLFTAAPRSLVHRMMSWPLCVHGNCLWHALSLCKLQSLGSRSGWTHILLPKGWVTALHNRPCFHRRLFQEARESKRFIHSQVKFEWPLLTSQLGLEISGVCCAVIARAAYSASKWVAGIISAHLFQETFQRKQMTHIIWSVWNGFVEIGLLWVPEGVICSSVTYFFAPFRNSKLLVSYGAWRQRSIFSWVTLAHLHLEQLSWASRDPSTHLQFQAHWSMSTLDFMAVLFVFYSSYNSELMSWSSAKNTIFFLFWLKLDPIICKSRPLWTR